MRVPSPQHGNAGTYINNTGIRVRGIRVNNTGIDSNTGIRGPSQQHGNMGTQTTTREYGYLENNMEIWVPRSTRVVICPSLTIRETMHTSDVRHHVACSIIFALMMKSEGESHNKSGRDKTTDFVRLNMQQEAMT